MARRRLTDAWRDQAACADYDPRYWDIDMRHLWPFGMAVCINKCPVRHECRIAHLGDRRSFGVYGGIAIHEGEQIT